MCSRCLGVLQLDPALYAEGSKNSLISYYLLNAPWYENAGAVSYWSIVILNSFK